MLHTLPETESSPRAGSFGESQISTSRWSPSSPRAQRLALGEGLAHGEQHLHRELSTLSSRRRVRLTAQQQPSRAPTSVKFAESLEVRLSAKKKHTAQKHFHRELYTFGECFVSAHDEFSKKNFTFSSPNFFLDPHTLKQYTCSKLAPFCLCYLYLTISLLSLYLFLIRPVWTASA
jgi:hypothetical protein